MTGCKGQIRAKEGRGFRTGAVSGRTRQDWSPILALVQDQRQVLSQLHESQDRHLSTPQQLDIDHSFLHELRDRRWTVLIALRGRVTTGASWPMSARAAEVTRAIAATPSGDVAMGCVASGA